MTTISPVRVPGCGARAWRGRIRALLHPATLLAVLVCAAASLGCWALANRPVALPGFTGEVGGLAFSPFQRGQSPQAGEEPTLAELRADLVRVAGVTRRIRTYTVRGVFAEIPALAAELGLHVTPGAWLARDAAANQAELARLIALAQHDRSVERVVVGNEAVLRGDLTAAQVAAAMRRVRQAVALPVSTAEPWHVWLAHPELAAAADFLTIHLLPYWEGVPEDDAVRFTLEKLDAVHAAFPGKPIVIGEVGWPSGGQDIGAAHAGRIAQARFLRAFFAAAQQRQLDYFVMEAFDQPWKTSSEGRAAGYWGMFDLDRQPKWALSGPVTERPGWAWWAAPVVTIAALLAWLLLGRRPDIRPAGKLLLAALAQGSAAALAGVLLTMSSRYLSPAAALVWGTLAAGQVLLILRILADGFELAETVFAGPAAPAPVVVAAPPDAPLPLVSLHLPLCNEPPDMVRQTLDALAALDYPAFEVLVVDNNTLEPALWEPVAEHCARLGPRFRFFHLARHPGFKAGALNFARRQMAPAAEIVGVLDSDYVVAPDWLRCLAPLFDDPRVGFVQCPQDYRDAGASRFKRLMYWEYAGFFHLGMVTRHARNAIIQHGTMTLIRAAALHQADEADEGPPGAGPIGGSTARAGGTAGQRRAAGRVWAEWCICEDAELGLRLLRRGWQAVYCQQSFGRGVMPDDFAAFRRQRFRWAAGAMQICRHHWRALLWPFDRDLTLGQRWHFVTGWLPWVGDALALLFLLMGIGWSAGLILLPLRCEFPIALFMLPSLGLFAFKTAQIFTLYRSRVPCPWQDRLGAAVAGLALSHTIGRAVWQGLLARRAVFRRTPKMAAAPALLAGLAMAREELALLLLSWTCVAGVAWTHGATRPALLWCVVLLTQSLPCLAAVAVSLLAAWPAAAGRRARRRRPLARPGQAGSIGSMVGRRMGVARRVGGD